MSNQSLNSFVNDVFIRINNIVCDKNESSTHTMYRISKYFPNIYYSKQEEMLNEGYEYDEYGGLIKRTIYGDSRISSSFFEHPESSYVIAWLLINISEKDFSLNSVGSRILELNETERSDFMKVYEIANKKLKQKYFPNE